VAHLCRLICEQLVSTHGAIVSSYLGLPEICGTGWLATAFKYYSAAESATDLCYLHLILSVQLSVAFLVAYLYADLPLKDIADSAFQ